MKNHILSALVLFSLTTTLHAQDVAGMHFLNWNFSLQGLKYKETYSYDPTSTETLRQLNFSTMLGYGKVFNSGWALNGGITWNNTYETYGDKDYTITPGVFIGTQKYKKIGDRFYYIPAAFVSFSYTYKEGKYSGYYEIRNTYTEGITINPFSFGYWLNKKYFINLMVGSGSISYFSQHNEYAGQSSGADKGINYSAAFTQQIQIGFTRTFVK